MATYGGHEGLVVGHGPALQVRHLVHRQFFLAAAVVGEHAFDPVLGVPQVELGHAILAKQPGHVVTAIGSDQRVIGLAANTAEAGDDRGVALAEIGTPDLVGIEQAEHKALPWRIHQAHHPRTLAVGQGWPGYRPPA